MTVCARPEVSLCGLQDVGVCLPTNSLPLDTCTIRDESPIALEAESYVTAGTISDTFCKRSGKKTINA